MRSLDTSPDEAGSSLLYWALVHGKRLMPSVLIEFRRGEGGGPTDSPEGPDTLELSFERRTTVRELIRRTVEENVQAQLRQSRRELQAGLAATSAGALSERQIREQALAGKVGIPSETSLRRKMRQSHIDVADRVRRAWEAFEKREFLLSVDGRMAAELDEAVALGTDSKVLFLRTAAFLWLPFSSKT